MFFVRNSGLALLVLGLITGAISVYFASTLYSATLAHRLLDERQVVAETLGREIAAVSQATSTDSAYISGLLSDVAQDLVGIDFIRLINSRSGVIEASSDNSEIGTRAPRLPSFTEGMAVVSRVDEKTIDISYSVNDERALWMGVASGLTQSAIIVFAIQQGIIILVLFLVIGVAVYLIQQRYFIRPIRKLYRELVVVDREVKKADTGGATPNIASDDIGTIVESFNVVAERIRATLIHDRNVSKLKSDFITTTAHQLRTPLSGVNWALESLLSGKENVLSEEQKQLVKRALEKTNELIGIVGTLLNAASIEKGQFGYHLEEVSLLDDIVATLEEEQTMAQEADIALSFDQTGAQGAPKVRIDRERVRWVLRNLIENAIRYTKAGGTVAISVSYDEKEITVKIADTGIGIKAADRDHIFQKFFRAKEAVEMRNDGSGLGLYIAKNIINHHGGKIWFESTEGKGTTFYLTIPIGKSEEMPEEHPGFQRNGI